MIGSTYTALEEKDVVELAKEGKLVKMLTLEELLPMSFGPEFLGK